MGFKRVGRRIKIHSKSSDSKVQLFLCNIPTLRRATYLREKASVVITSNNSAFSVPQTIW